MKMNKRRILIALILVCVGVGSYAIYKNAELDEQKSYHVILIPKIVDASNDFWTSLIEGAKMAAEENNLQLQVRAPDSENAYEQQNELIQWAIDQKPDALIVAPASYTKNSDMLQKVKENNIKLVYMDSQTDVKIEDAAVATDNIEAGTQLGSYAKELIDATPIEEPSIGIVGHVQGSSTAIDRESGVRSGLGAYADNVEEVVFCDSVFGKAYDLTVDLIRKHPHMNVIVGLNEYSAVGAARAIKDLGLKDKVTVVGFDSSLEEIKLMEEGVFRGIVIQKPFNMGYLGVEQTAKLLNGAQVDDLLDSGSKLITMNNIYTEENQKLLFPFVGEQQ